VFVDERNFHGRGPVRSFMFPFKRFFMRAPSIATNLGPFEVDADVLDPYPAKIVSSVETLGARGDHRKACWPNSGVIFIPRELDLSVDAKIEIDGVAVDPSLIGNKPLLDKIPKTRGIRWFSEPYSLSASSFRIIGLSLRSR
jgi:hypothetical protein